MRYKRTRNMAGNVETAEEAHARRGNYAGSHERVAMSFEVGRSIVDLRLADGEFRLVNDGSPQRILCSSVEPEAVLRGAAELLDAPSERERMRVADALANIVGVAASEVEERRAHASPRR